MRNRLITFCLISAICWLACADTFAQDRQRESRRRRGRDSFNMTDESREAMYDSMVSRYHESFARDYELTDDQSKEVRARLEKLKAEHQAYVEPQREKLDQMRQEIHDLFHNRRNEREINRERIRKIIEQMREIRDASPLMNRETVTSEVEALLPPEQVEKGRAQAEQRRSEMRRYWEDRRDRGRDRWDRERGQRDRRRDWRGDRDSMRFSRGDRWDRYCEDFKRRYQLNTSQVATADSVLRELKKERDMYNEAHQAEFDALNSIEDRNERWNAYRELTAPTNILFNHLRQRLDSIPTQAQKKAGGSMPDFWDRSRSNERRRERTTTRPANIATRPADTATRPANN